MFCKHCGKNLPEGGSSFCPACGKETSEGAILSSSSSPDPRLLLASSLLFFSYPIIFAILLTTNPFPTFVASGSILPSLAAGFSVLRIYQKKSTKTRAAFIFAIIFTVMNSINAIIVTIISFNQAPFHVLLCLGTLIGAPTCFLVWRSKMLNLKG